MHTQSCATLRGREQGRSESLTVTYNLFMLHAVIWHTWEKVNFFSQREGSSKAAVYDFKITTCSSNILTYYFPLPPSGFQMTGLHFILNPNGDTILSMHSCARSGKRCPSWSSFRLG